VIDMNIHELEDRLDELRAPRGYHGEKLPRGLSIGPYIQGNPEGGYGGEHLQEIRNIRRELSGIFGV